MMKKGLIIIVLLTIYSCSNSNTSNPNNGGSSGSSDFVWSEIKELPGSQNHNIIATRFDDIGNILVLFTHGYGRFSIAKFSGDFWKEPEELPVGVDPGYIGEFSFTIGHNGDSMLLWSAMETYRTIHHLYAAEFNSASGWGTVKTIENFSDSSARGPISKFDQNGILAVWRNDDNGSLWSSYYSSNNNLWSDEVAVGNIGYAGEYYLQLTANSQFILFWRDHADMFISRWSNDQNWATPIKLNIAETIDTSIAIDLLSDQNGDLFAVWGMNQDVCSCQIKNDQAISFPDCVNVDTDGWRIKSAINRRGDIFVTYTKMDENPYYSLYGIHYNPASGWDQPVLLENHSGSATSIQIEFDDMDNAILVWESQYSESADSIKTSIYTKKYDIISGWEEEKQLWTSSVQFGLSAMPKLAIDSAGNAFCVWLETILDSNEPWTWRGINIWLSTSTASGQWRQPEIINSGEILSYPFFEMDDSGKAIVCWQEQDRVFAKLYK